MYRLENNTWVQFDRKQNIWKLVCIRKVNTLTHEPAPISNNSIDLKYAS